MCRARTSGARGCHSTGTGHWFTSADAAAVEADWWHRSNFIANDIKLAAYLLLLATLYWP